MTSVSGECQLVTADPITGDTAVCSVPTNVVANLGDRDDSYWDWDGPSFVDAGSGNDMPIIGGPGDDSLHGGIGSDELEGWDGDDLLDGGADVDRYYGDSVSACIAYSCPSGRDDIRARDGQREEINCGPGTDTLQADDNDVIYDSVTLVDQCEGHLGTPAGPSGAAGGSAGGAAFRVAGAKLDRRGRIVVRFTALRSRGRLTVSLTVAFRPVGGGSMSRQVRRVTMRRG